MNSEKIRNIKIGLFAIAAFVILCVGLNYLKGRDLFSSGAKLTACYAAVDGLTDSSPILYHGFKVGSVKDIEINQYAKDPSQVFTVTINIEKNLEVPEDSRAEIVSTDLLGGKGIEIILGKSDKMLGSGDTVSTSVKLGLIDELMPVKDQASTLMASATDVFNGVDSVLDANNRQNIAQILSNLNGAMRNIEVLTRNLSQMSNQSGAIGGTFNSTSELMANLNKQSGRIDSIMRNANKFTQNLSDADMGHAISELDSMMASVNSFLSANGNVKKLANDAELYDNLTMAIDNLNRLLVDIRLNPSRYINVSAFKFGGKQIYFSDTNSAVNVMRGTVYAVCVAKSKKPIDIPTVIAEHKVLEYSYDGKYRYIVVPFATEQEAISFKQSAGIADVYPESEIDCYVDGVLK